MVQIKEQRHQMKSGAWAALSPEQRQEKEMGLKHICRLATFFNVTGIYRYP